MIGSRRCNATSLHTDVNPIRRDVTFWRLECVLVVVRNVLHYAIIYMDYSLCIPRWHSIRFGCGRCGHKTEFAKRKQYPVHEHIS